MGDITGGAAGQDTAEQVIAFVNGIGGQPAVAPLAAVVTDGYGAPTFAVVTLTSATPAVNTLTKKQTYRVAITGAAAGTVGITVTDLASVVHTVVPVVAANAVASQVFEVPVPAGWSITVTVVTATINAASVVTTGL